MYSNDLLLKIFIRKFGINPNTKKNKLIINELRNYAKIAVWKLEFYNELLS